MVEDRQVDELAPARLLQALPHALEAIEDQPLGVVVRRARRHGVDELAVAQGRALRRIVLALVHQRVARQVRRRGRGRRRLDRWSFNGWSFNGWSLNGWSFNLRSLGRGGRGARAVSIAAAASMTAAEPTDEKAIVCAALRGRTPDAAIGVAATGSDGGSAATGSGGGAGVLTDSATIAEPSDV